MILCELQSQFDKLVAKKNKLQGEIDILNRQINNEKQAIDNKTTQRELASKSVEIMDAIQKSSVESVQENFEKVVTYALQYIFDSNDFSFAMDFGRRGNLQTLDFNLKTPELSEPADPIDTESGGAVDVMSVALRAIILELFVPKIEGFIVLDESFKGLSEEYLQNASYFLRELNKKLGRQIIMITHKEEFKQNADNLIEIGA